MAMAHRWYIINAVSGHEKKVAESIRKEAAEKGYAELISEVALAIEMGCQVEDIALTVHPHPTLSESIMMAAEIYEGTITDLYMPKKKKEG